MSEEVASITTVGLILAIGLWLWVLLIETVLFII